MAGISDLIVLYKGRFYAIEVKLPENKRSPDGTPLQKRFLDRVNLCGGVGFIAKSVEDIKEIIK